MSNSLKITKTFYKMKKLNFCFHSDHLTQNFPQTEKNHTNKKWEIGLMFVLAAAVQRGWKTRGWKNKREMWFLPRMHLTLITCCHASPDKKERNCVLSKDKTETKTSESFSLLSLVVTRYWTKKEKCIFPIFMFCFRY